MKGINRTYRLASGNTLLRNAGSVDPAMDGWWYDAVGFPPFLLTRATVLVMLRQPGVVRI